MTKTCWLVSKCHKSKKFARTCKSSCIAFSRPGDLVVPAVKVVSLAETCSVNSKAAAILIAIAVCFGVFCWAAPDAQKDETCSSRPSWIRLACNGRHTAKSRRAELTTPVSRGSGTTSVGSVQRCTASCSRSPLVGVQIWNQSLIFSCCPF